MNNKIIFYPSTPRKYPEQGLKKMCIPNRLFINFRAAMKEVICRVGSMEDIETVTSRVSSRVNSRQTSRASSIIKLRKTSSNVGETSKFINPSPRKNSQDQSTDLWNFNLLHVLFNFVVRSYDGGTKRQIKIPVTNFELP